MGELRVRMDDSLLTKLESFATSHNVSPEDQVIELVRKAVEKQPPAESFAEIARRIAAMTPAGVEQPDVVEMLREDRNR